jgi:hypothetical protein
MPHGASNGKPAGTPSSNQAATNNRPANVNNGQAGATKGSTTAQPTGSVSAETERRWAGSPPVSIVELIASPSRFDNKPISVEGFFGIEGKDWYLFFTKEDADYCSHQNAIPMLFAKKLELVPDNPRHSLFEFDHRRVFVFGRFNAKTRQLVDVDKLASVRRFYDIGRPIQSAPPKGPASKGGGTGGAKTSGGSRGSLLK